MKKSIFAIIAIFIINLGFCQTFNRVYKTALIKNIDEKWVEKEANFPERMFVILDGSEVKITNESETKLVTYGDPYIKKTPDGMLSSWGAYDKDGKSCVFLMYKYLETQHTLFSILYAKEGMGVEFYTTPHDKE